ncbi:MAG: L-threonylcarbamoyladenylate synthase [Chitinophagaceae bacterium]
MEFEPDINACLDVLNRGGLILYPTDTVWGIGCDATNPEAIEKVYHLKKRDDHKSLIILMMDICGIEQYVQNLPLKVLEFLSFAKEPTTVIYERAFGLPARLLGQNQSIAIRLTSDPFCATLISRLGRPIVSTSANISGEPTPVIFKDISSEIKAGVDYVVGYRQEDSLRRKSSRIVRFDSDGHLEIIRN